MRALSLWILFSLFLAALAVSASIPPAIAAQPAQTVVLVIVDDLSWEDAEKGPVLHEVFREGAAATLSVVQGTKPPEDARFGYVFLGAGSRVDTRFLPEVLPADPAQIPGAFDGPASTVRPGALGDALERAGVRSAAVGDEARLVAMDSDADVPLRYESGDPLGGLESALNDGAGFVAVDAENAAQATELVQAARRTGGAVAVAAPNGPPETPNLAPFALVRPGSEGGLLYSPTTRTEGLLTNADVAPTLLALLDVEAPPEMTGRAAELRPGESERAELLQRRLWFVAEDGFRVWGVVGALWAGALAVGMVRGGRRGASAAVLALAALPAGALLAAVVPVTGVLPVAALTALLAGGMTALSWRISGGFAWALALVSLASAVLVVMDAAAGGALERFSTLGYNPATGTRFYGVGNEYAAVLAGGLTLGYGVLAYRRRIPAALPAAVGAVAVLVLGLPTMGADVGGSLALGIGVGATVGLLRGGGPRGVILWAAGGFALAAALFLASGLLFPEVSHGSRAAGGGGGLGEIVVRKLAISVGFLLNPILLLLLVAGSAA
ncbi:MAG: hypothetical protein M3341_10680, partial [Actinomycetota bacterium]|nr:hypothetical protein [Actinomycetota bacterium]